MVMDENGNNSGGELNNNEQTQRNRSWANVVKGRRDVWGRIWLARWLAKTNLGLCLHQGRVLNQYFI